MQLVPLGYLCRDFGLSTLKYKGREDVQSEALLLGACFTPRGQPVDTWAGAMVLFLKKR